MRTLYFCPVSIFFLAQSEPSQIGCLPYFHTWCGLRANLGCRSETCCTRLAEIQDAKNRQKSPSAHHRTIFVELYLRNQGTHRQSEKKLIKLRYLPHMSSQYGELRPTSGTLVWGTPAKFNEFRVLAALLHGTLLVGVSQTAALNRGRHLYLAERPSRWALALISS